VSKITTYHCDFSSQVARHEAQYHLRLDDKEIGSEQDACDKHLCDLVRMWFRTEASLKHLRIIRIPGTTLPDPNQPRKQSAAKKECPECGDLIHVRSFKRHLERGHGVPTPSVTAVQGEQRD
jgi:hypothetical protein